MMNTSCIIDDDVAGLPGQVFDRFVIHVIHPRSWRIFNSNFEFRANRMNVSRECNISRDVRHGDVSRERTISADQRTKNVGELADQKQRELHFRTCERELVYVDPCLILRIPTCFPAI